MKLLKNILIIFILGLGLSVGYIEIYKKLIIENPKFSIDINKILIKIDNQKLTVLHAENFSQQSRGLMFKSSGDLENVDGMIFNYSTNPNQVSFWMKNTYIDLDLLLFDEHKQLVEIFEMTKNDSDTIYTSSKSNIAYALELKKGLYKEYNLKIGQKLNF